MESHASLAARRIMADGYEILRLIQHFGAKSFYLGAKIDETSECFNFIRCMNNCPHNLHKLLPKGS